MQCLTECTWPWARPAPRATCRCVAADGREVGARQLPHHVALTSFPRSASSRSAGSLWSTACRGARPPQSCGAATCLTKTKMNRVQAKITRIQFPSHSGALDISHIRHYVHNGKESRNAITHRPRSSPLAASPLCSVAVDAPCAAPSSWRSPSRTGARVPTLQSKGRHLDVAGERKGWAYPLVGQVECWPLSSAAHRVWWRCRRRAAPTALETT